MVVGNTKVKNNKELGLAQQYSMYLVCMQSGGRRRGERKDRGKAERDGDRDRDRQREAERIGENTRETHNLFLCCYQCSTLEQAHSLLRFKKTNSRSDVNLVVSL